MTLRASDLRSASQDPGNCGNCGRPIGRLEQPRFFARRRVCADCYQRLVSAEIDGGFSAYGISSRGTAWVVALVGLFLTPAGIGVPLFIWGVMAERKLLKHAKMNGRQGFEVRMKNPPRTPKGGSSL